MHRHARCWNLVSASALLLSAASVAAQPTPFVDIGTFAAPASPAYTQELIDDAPYLEYNDPPDELTVKWVRFQLSQPVSGDLYLDITARNYSTVGVSFVLYDHAGNLVAADDTDGSFAASTAPGLSFGSTAERVPWIGPACVGQDGALDAGVYWLAIVAGSLSEITVGPNGWAVSTPVTLELGFDDGQLFMEMYFFAGNTTSPGAPGNDDCSNATTIGEDAGEVPAWSGSNVGATQDGLSPCYPDVPGLTTKDVWLRYVPSQSGWVTMTLSGGAGGAAVPILTRFAGGCGSAPVRCAGGGSFASPVGTRLTFEVFEGVPVLLSAAVRAGQWGPLTLSVRLIGPPCDLQMPPSAADESEACGEAANDGCGVTPSVFGSIALGQTVRGTLFNTLSTRDWDYYRFTLAATTTVRATARAQLPFSMAIQRTSATTGCPTTTVVSVSSLSYFDLCQDRAIEATLAPGTYVVAISHAAQDGFECGSGYEGYRLSVIDPNAPPCDADYDGNGQVQVPDIFAFLTDWFAGVPGAVHFGGIPGVPAIFAFLSAWFAGC